jgi:hypothetical protein
LSRRAAADDDQVVDDVVAGFRRGQKSDLLTALGWQDLKLSPNARQRKQGSTALQLDLLALLLLG